MPELVCIREGCHHGRTKHNRAMTSEEPPPDDSRCLEPCCCCPEFQEGPYAD